MRRSPDHECLAEIGKQMGDWEPTEHRARALVAAGIMPGIACSVLPGGAVRRGLIAFALAGLLAAGGRALAQSEFAADGDVRDQVTEVLGPLRDSEAEYAMGAYVPGEGVTFSLELVRGPNTAEGQTASEGTRAWALYLLETFGPRLTAVPDDELISISVDFYDVADERYHSLVVSVDAADLGNPFATQCWLDGALCEGTFVPPVDPNATPPYPAEMSAPAPPPSATKTPVAPATPPLNTAGFRAADLDEPGGPRPLTDVAVIVDTRTVNAVPEATATPDNAGAFSDPSLVDGVWLPVNGAWIASDGMYVQKELGKFDLVSFYRNPIGGNITFAADMTFLEGEMGGGLMFLAPTREGKAGAHMISFTAGGGYLQWGRFDDAGVFQFQGGANVLPRVDDGTSHRLAVEVSGDVFTVNLDGQTVASGVPIGSGPRDGYVGLFVNTSIVAFDNVTLEADLT